MMDLFSRVFSKDLLTCKSTFNAILTLGHLRQSRFVVRGVPRCQLAIQLAKLGVLRDGLSSFGEDVAYRQAFRYGSKSIRKAESGVERERHPAITITATITATTHFPTSILKTQPFQPPIFARCRWLLLLFSSGAMALSDPSGVSELIASHHPSLSQYEDLYRTLHANPELSEQEVWTAAVIAAKIEKFDGFEVHTGIGGHGVVGVFRNGTGKTVLIRAELDALPLEERTDLPYASFKRMLDSRDNVEKPVMHACGHDMHMTAVLAATELLLSCRAAWSGTLVILFQGHEESGSGAQAMVDDGLYDPARHNIPRPDVMFAGHTMPRKAGIISTRKGVFNSAANSFRVTVFGRGGHGSRPHHTIDAVVLASSIVMKLQGIVSRETNPQDAVVVTVGSLQAGDSENVIADKAILKINARSLTNESRASVKAAIKRIIQGECLTAGCAELPLIEETTSFPLLYNDEAVTDVVENEFKRHFGNRFEEATVSMGSEDFGNLGPSPGCFWNIGCIDANEWDEALANGKLAKIPGNHSAGFKPVIQPTLFAAMESYALATLAFLKK
ncbi:hypothetical protein G7Y89_g1034 [Cudoniella acicularis]|uniref:Peptidase M20 dimerisation domain-containing protein n=1 Tax=Cudoniella acicularis TaxID=354080 RepID=A0A8H4RX37_9HELO|nr:hypothetical protein G7Y89_g1034 [Cudoniella acicularis]